LGLKVALPLAYAFGPLLHYWSKVVWWDARQPVCSEHPTWLNLVHWLALDLLRSAEAHVVTARPLALAFRARARFSSTTSTNHAPPWTSGIRVSRMSLATQCFPNLGLIESEEPKQLRLRQLLYLSNPRT
jgi:hypothetical protein